MSIGPDPEHPAAQHGPIPPLVPPRTLPLSDAAIDAYLAAEEAGDDVILTPWEAPRRQRRFWLPLFLLLCTCVSTFLAGCYHWYPVFLGERAPLQDVHGAMVRDRRGVPQLFTARQLIKRNWRDGLLFTVCVMGVLLMHEMGHFLMAHRHRIPASYPFFIPLPVMITGTMGAVIGMEGSRANRKELFDIGLAGPLAGLVLTIPLVIVGILTSNSVATHSGMPLFGTPLLVQLITPLLKDVPRGLMVQPNPIYMAGWVGMLVTGLNMMPVSQLDGGHVAYAILGRYARWLGWGLLLLAMSFIVAAKAYNWMVMLLIIILIGIDHPRTADDHVKLGPLRWVLGAVSLLIPIFCFSPIPLEIAK